MRVFIGRVKYKKGTRRWWLWTSVGLLMKGKPGETKAQLLERFQRSHPAAPKRYTRYKGAMTPAEAAATVADAWEV